MLDGPIRPYIDPPLNKLGAGLARCGITANTVTLVGFGLGVFACLLISQEFYFTAFIFLVLNRVLDGLDGGVARTEGVSDFGGFLDILCDFIIYAGVVFSFALADPTRALAATFLIFSFIGPITSFLAYAIIAEKRKITTTSQGKKSFYYLGGVCEGTETFFTLALLCLFPNFFSYIAVAYGVLCWLTTGGRAFQAWHDFKK